MPHLTVTDSACNCCVCLGRRANYRGGTAWQKHADVSKLPRFSLLDSSWLLTVTVAGIRPVVMTSKLLLQVSSRKGYSHISTSQVGINLRRILQQNAAIRWDVLSWGQTCPWRRACSMRLAYLWFRIDYLLWNFGPHRYIYYLYIMRINVSVWVQLYALGRHNKKEGGTGLLHYSAIVLIG